jgi:hypothetical protein
MKTLLTIFLMQLLTSSDAQLITFFHDNGVLKSMNPNTGVVTTVGGGSRYAIQVQALTSSPVDNQTVYFGMLPKVPVTAANTSKIYIRRAGTITGAEIYSYAGTAGTAESWTIYIRKNNTTDFAIATVAANTNERVFSNQALSIPVNAGDYIEIKSINPSWQTNPLTLIYSGYVLIE